jgi:hypothetical protein
LRQELLRVNNDNDRLEERLSALEAGQVERARQDAASQGSASVTHPPLKVVRLEPEAELAAADDHDEPAAVVSTPAGAPAAAQKQDGSPRPMIKGTGQKVYSTHSSGAEPASEPPAKSATSRGGQ